MKVGGFQKFSLIDYPGKICCIVFTQGCNFRCPYCHNPELINFKEKSLIDDNKIFSFLEKRKGKLDAVCITGGEPTLQPDLINFINKIKDMGYLVKIDSNGTSPKTLEKIINMGIVDYFAMDFKSPIKKYHNVVNSSVDKEDIIKSMNVIMSSGVDYEFRTTVVKSQLSKKDLIEISKTIKGAKLYVLQKFVPSQTLDPSFSKKKTYTDSEFKELRKEIKNYVERCIVR